MGPATVTVTVNRFAKYKGRKDVENPSWMKISNRILEDPDFYHFTHEEILVWVQILARASQKQQETVVLDLAHCERVCRLTPAAVHSAIEKLRALNIIECVTPKKVKRNGGVTSTLRGIEEKREEEKREEENSTPTRERAVVPIETKSANREVWEAYRQAYLARYQVEPIRNAKVNANIAQFTARVGAVDAADIARFYVGHNDSLYVKSMHAFALCLRDAEAIRTQWVRGKAVTQADIRRFERHQETAAIIDAINLEGV